MKILVIGAGGIGGYFGGRLVEGGADVTFLVRQARYENLVRQGLRIRSPLGDAQLNVKLVRADTVTPVYDLALLACKAYDLQSAMEALAGGLSPQGAVLPLLNGIDHLPVLQARFGIERVLGGVAKIGVTLASDGAISHHSETRHLIFGELHGRMTARVHAISVEFAKAPAVECEATDRIMHALWEKFVILGTTASMTSLMRGTIGEIASTPYGTDLLIAALEVAAEAARYRGYPMSEKFLCATRTAFADTASRANSSLWRDLEAGNPTEHDQIVGAMIREIRAAGLDDTLFRIAYTHLKVAELRRNRLK